MTLFSAFWKLTSLPRVPWVHKRHTPFGPPGSQKPHELPVSPWVEELCVSYAFSKVLGEQTDAYANQRLSSLLSSAIVALPVLFTYFYPWQWNNKVNKIFSVLHCRKTLTQSLWKQPPYPHACHCSWPFVGTAEPFLFWKSSLFFFFFWPVLAGQTLKIENEHSGGKCDFSWKMLKAMMSVVSVGESHERFQNKMGNSLLKVTESPMNQWPRQNRLGPPNTWGMRALLRPRTRSSEHSDSNKTAPVTQPAALIWDASVSTVSPVTSLSRESKAGLSEDTSVCTQASLSNLHASCG